MDHYDENGDKIDQKDLNYLQILHSSVIEVESEVIESFIKVEPIYLLLNNKGKKLSSSEIRKIHKEFQNVNFKFDRMLLIWNEHQLNPFDRYDFKIEYKGKKYLPYVSVIPQNFKQIKLYLDFTSEWIHNTLLEIKDKPFEIYSESDYLKDFNKFSSLTEEVIDKEIERIVNHITTLVTELNLNPNLIDYGNYFEYSTIDIDFFRIKRIDRIENIWGLAIGLGILFGDYKYLSYLNRKKRDYNKNNRYILKENHSYHSEFKDFELKKIYKQLVEEDFIEEMNNPDEFIKIFRENKLTSIKPIIWKKVQNRWLSIFTLIELLAKPDYSNRNQFKTTFIYCFTFKNGVKVVENIKSDYEKSTNEPFEKIVINGKLQEKIKKIVESD